MSEELSEDSKPLITIGTLGHVTHGKTSLSAAIKLIFSHNSGATGIVDEQIVQLRQWVSINVARIEYETVQRRYIHIDCCSHLDQVKNLIRGLVHLDGAILVVSAVDGCTSQTHEQIRLARYAGVSNMVVFLNKADLVADLELIKLTEIKVRELLTVYDFPGDRIPVVTGSALQVLSCGCGKRDCPWCGQIVKLMDMVDCCISLPPDRASGSFLLPVEDVYARFGRGSGMLATGRVKQGRLHVGDIIEIVGFAATVKSTIVIAIMKALRNSVDQAVANDVVGVVTYGLTREELERGQVLATSGCIQPHTTFKAEIYVLREDETLNHASMPIIGGKYSRFYIWTTDIWGRVTLPAGMKAAIQGSNISILVELRSPIAIQEGLRFLISGHSGQAIAAGIVAGIIP